MKVHIFYLDGSEEHNEIEDTRGSYGVTAIGYMFKIKGRNSIVLIHPSQVKRIVIEKDEKNSLHI